MLLERSNGDDPRFIELYDTRSSMPGHDLDRKLSEFQAYYNLERVHASLCGKTPSSVAGGETIKQAEVNDLRWVSHCHDLVQLPMAT